jgi:threonine synthase
MVIVGATSGDTGSAAIYGIRGKKNVDCVILFPEGRTSRTQELQMTTVLDDNIQCIGVKGTFDDCQDIVKDMFVSEYKEALGLLAELICGLNLAC